MRNRGDANLGNKRIFAENLNYYLEKTGILKKEIASKIAVNPCTISDWCACRSYPRMDKIEAMAKIFECEMSDLVDKRSVENKYYLNKTAKELAEELVNSPESLTMFQAYSKLSPQNQTIVRLMIDSLSKGEK